MLHAYGQLPLYLLRNLVRDLRARSGWRLDLYPHGLRRHAFGEELDPVVEYREQGHDHDEYCDCL